MYLLFLTGNLSLAEIKKYTVKILIKMLFYVTSPCMNV